MKPSISEPCHVKWNSMTPSAGGRYCGSCEKVVVDFTRMSDEELKNYFIHHTSESTCGRMNIVQLEDPALSKNGRIVWSWYTAAREKITGKYPRVAALFVISLLLVLTGCRRRMLGRTTTHGSIRFLEDNGPVPVAAQKAPSQTMQKADS